MWWMDLVTSMAFGYYSSSVASCFGDVRWVEDEGEEGRSRLYPGVDDMWIDRTAIEVSVTYE